MRSHAKLLTLPPSVPSYAQVIYATLDAFAGLAVFHALQGCALRRDVVSNERSQHREKKGEMWLAMRGYSTGDSAQMFGETLASLQDRGKRKIV
eukprot:216302-Pelagomonas_calceolata.AAC.3